MWVAVFAGAMAYLESAVVVYLRQIYYPQGFDFPLATAATATILIEIGREAATIVMLIAIGVFCGRTRLQRFAYLMLAFGLWDIFYYVWLKLFIGWPESLLTWDVLFLIPLPWIGPVLAPVLVSAALIGAGLWIILREELGSLPRFPRWVWWAEIGCGAAIIAAFLWDAKNIVKGGYPAPFRWDIYAAGLIMGVALFLWHIVPGIRDKSPQR
jgi:hypothetical protein